MNFENDVASEHLNITSNSVIFRRQEGSPYCLLELVLKNSFGKFLLFEKKKIPSPRETFNKRRRVFVDRFLSLTHIYLSNEAFYRNFISAGEEGRRGLISS